LFTSFFVVGLRLPFQGQGHHISRSPHRFEMQQTSEQTDGNTGPVLVYICHAMRYVAQLRDRH